MDNQEISPRLESRGLIELPRIIDVKFDAIQHTSENVHNLGLGKNGVIIVDNFTYEIAGQRVEENLIDGGFDVHVERIDAATMNNVEQAITTYEETDANFAVAVGGGTVIDVTKFSSFQHKIPFVSIPTAASHDGISSARAAIKADQSSHSLAAHSPILVIGDVGTMSKAPRRFAISGAGDLISNKSAVLDWELSKRITGEHVSQYASLLSKLTADTIIQERNEIARDPIVRTYTVFKGLISSSMSMCIAGSSRPSSGAEHLISHKLDHMLQKPAMHGEQVGIMSIFTTYLHRDNWKELRKTLKILDAPIYADQINADEDQLIDAILTAQDLRPERYTILKTGVTKLAVKRGLEITGII